MDFRSQQEKAHSRTKIFCILFVLAVCGIVLVTYGALLLLYVAKVDISGTTGFWHPQLFYSVFFITLGIVGSGSLYKISQLSNGGDAVAQSLGGRLILHQANNWKDIRVLNIVEEMAIASGIPCPRVYILEEEHGINAFAAGLSTQNAVVAFSRGAIETLTRDELQGVAAHEFSHILNGDMRLNLRMIGVLYGILCISIVGEVLLRSRSRRSKDNNGVVVVGLVLYIIGTIGVFFGRMIQSAVSRSREYLADASAVQFTRNPIGIGGALKKILLLQQGSHIESAAASEASHLFFSSASSGFFSSLFATHPPLQERIELIAPELLKDASLAEENETESNFLAEQKTHALGFAAPSPQKVMNSVGSVGDVSVGHSVLDNLPATLREDVRNPLSALGIVYALLLSDDEGSRATQKDVLRKYLDSREWWAVQTAEPVVKTITAQLCFPLAELALPALRFLSDAQKRRCIAVIQEMHRSVSIVGVSQYFLRLLVSDALSGERKAKAYAPSRYVEIVPYLVALILGMQADDLQKVKDILSARFTEEEITLQNAASLFESALETLKAAPITMRMRILESCLKVVLLDRKVTVEEFEALRTIGAVIQCPVPLK